MGIIREGIKGYMLVAIAAFLIFGLIVALNYAGLLVLPAFLTQERTAYKNSYQYTEAKNTELLNMITEYSDLETKKQEYVVSNNPTYSGLIDNIDSQQKAIADKIRNDADLVQNQNELPNSVKQFLIEHPR
jgi:CHASE3 domain sensor protein